MATDNTTRRSKGEQEKDSRTLGRGKETHLQFNAALMKFLKHLKNEL